MAPPVGIVCRSRYLAIVSRSKIVQDLSQAEMFHSSRRLSVDFAMALIKQLREVSYEDTGLNSHHADCKLVRGTGTFPRASRTLASEWYPMDVEDAYALQRRGYVDSTFGDIPHNSYRDRETNKPHSMGMSINTSITNTSVEGQVTISPSGSVMVHPKSPDRRAAYGKHMSRLYSSQESLDDDPRYPRPEDHYSGYRKWMPEGNSRPPLLPSEAGSITDLSDYIPMPPSNQSSSSPRKDKEKQQSSPQRPASPSKAAANGSPSKSPAASPYRSIGQSPIKSWSDLELHLTGQHQPPSTSSAKPTSSRPQGDREVSSSSRPIQSSQIDQSDRDSEHEGPGLDETIQSNGFSVDTHTSNSELAEYLRWLEGQQQMSKPASTTSKPSPSTSATAAAANPELTSYSRTPSPSKIPRLSQSPEKPWKKYAPASSLSPDHPAEYSNNSTSAMRTPQRSTSRPPSGIPRSKSKLSTPITADPHPYLLPGEDPTLESKFSAHDLEYTPTHPREAAMKPEMVDIDQTFAAVANPLKHLMVTPSKL
jgi:hypothetical protein